MEYLDYEVTELPDSVENIFCKPLDQNGSIQKANENQMKIIFFGMTSPKSEIDAMYENFKNEYMLINILDSRLKMLGCEVDKMSQILISISCETPGEIVMYSNYLAYKMKQLGIDSLDLEKTCTQIFPSGFFTKESLHEYWDKQKVNTKGNPGSDNLLDYSSACVSIMK